MHQNKGIAISSGLVVGIESADGNLWHSPSVLFSRVVNLDAVLPCPVFVPRLSLQLPPCPNPDLCLPLPTEHVGQQAKPNIAVRQEAKAIQGTVPRVWPEVLQSAGGASRRLPAPANPPLRCDHNSASRSCASQCARKPCHRNHLCPDRSGAGCRNGSSASCGATAKANGRLPF